MRVLITGATGLVGSSIAGYLSGRGLLLRLASRTFVPYELNNSSSCQINWNSQASLEAACKDVDFVIHASGMNSRDCELDPISALLVNGVGTARLRLAAVAAGVRRIIYFSTAHVYQNPLLGTITEENCPLNLHPYATSHIAGESALYSSPNTLGPEIFILRMSNAFGAPLHPGANCWNLLANNLCKQAVLASSLRLTSSGTQLRNFVPLGYVCSVIERILALQSPQNSFQVFNLGGFTMSVHNFAKLIQEQAYIHIGRYLPIEYTVTPAPFKTQRLDYCSSRLSDFLGLSCPEPVAELSQLLRFCQHHFIKY